MPEAAISVEVSPDAMQAVLHLPAGASMPASQALDLLIKAGVNTGVVEAELNLATEARPEDRHLVVARGIPAVLAVDARIEYLVDFAIRIEEGKDHKVDFHEMGKFHEVAAGTVLARLVPKQAGTAGKTVLGKVLAVRDPKDLDLTSICGEGTAVLVKEQTVLVAERGGLVVKRRDGHLDIFPQIEVPGNLDMHWGNIKTSLPVKIRGDAISGFILKSGGDVEIKGAIEDARVSVKGSLNCAGILPGSHRVKAHGDIVTKHISGREVKCRNLDLASDMRNCTVYATGSVKAKLVISSKIHAGGDVVCEDLGNADEMGGLVQAGADPLALALFQLAKREHDTLVQEVADGKTKCKRLAVWLKQEQEEASRQKLAKDLRLALAAFEDACQRLARCEGVLNNSILRCGNNPEATITVTRSVFPGIEIMIGAEARYVVQRPMGPTVFRQKDGRVFWDVGGGNA